MRRVLLVLCVVVLAGGAVFLWIRYPALFRGSSSVSPELAAFVSELSFPEATSTDPRPVQPAYARPDIGPGDRLPEPPEDIKGIYLTGWSAGVPSRVAAVIELAKQGRVNAVVIDIKDYSGYVSYRMPLPEVKAVGADREIRIARPNALLKQLHDEGIYVIGRVTVFEDPVFAKAHPEFAIRRAPSNELWKDRLGLMWLDPAATEVWAYNMEIAKDAFDRGFDEVNFDYVRFPADGDLASMVFPVRDPKVSRREIIRDFFEYLRRELEGGRISADLFGLVTVERSDLGIGQVLEDALPYFDAVSPMVYPSHFAPGFRGFTNPADHPGEVVGYSLERAKARREDLARRFPDVRLGVIRPWLQDFDMGARYDRPKIEAQIAAAESFSGGWMIWDPRNIYSDLR